MSRVRLIGTTEEFHAIRAVKAIREVTGLGLAPALELVTRLEQGECPELTTVDDLRPEELAALFSGCGVVLESLRS